MNNYHPCLQGHYCQSGELHECSPGTFQAETGASECLLCPEGTHCPEFKTIEPLPCPAGFYCLEGTHAAFECPDGNNSPVGSKEIKDCYFFSEKPTTVEITTGYASGSGAETVMPASTPTTSTSSSDIHTTIIATSEITLPDSDFGSTEDHTGNGNGQEASTVATTELFPTTMIHETTIPEFATTQEVSSSVTEVQNFSTDSTEVIQDETSKASSTENMSGFHTTMGMPQETSNDLDESSGSYSGEINDHTSMPIRTTTVDHISGDSDSSTSTDNKDANFDQTTVVSTNFIPYTTVMVTDHNLEITTPVITTTEEVYLSTEFLEVHEEITNPEESTEYPAETSGDTDDSSALVDVTTVSTTEYLSTTVVVTNQETDVTDEMHLSTTPSEFGEATTKFIEISGQETTIGSMHTSSSDDLDEFSGYSGSQSEKDLTTTSSNEQSFATNQPQITSDAYNGDTEFLEFTTESALTPTNEFTTVVDPTEITFTTDSGSITGSGDVPITTEIPNSDDMDPQITTMGIISEATETTSMDESAESTSESTNVKTTTQPITEIIENQTTKSETNEINVTTDQPDHTDGLVSDTTVAHFPTTSTEAVFTTDSDFSGIEVLTTTTFEIPTSSDGTTVIQPIDTTHVDLTTKVETTEDTDIDEFTFITTPPPPPFPVTSFPTGSGSEMNETEYTTAGAPNRPIELTTIIDHDDMTSNEVTGSGEFLEQTTSQNSQSFVITTEELFVDEQTTDTEIFTFPSSTIFEPETTTGGGQPTSSESFTDFTTNSVQTSTLTEFNTVDETTFPITEESGDSDIIATTMIINHATSDMMPSTQPVPTSSISPITKTIEQQPITSTVAVIKYF